MSGYCVRVQPRTPRITTTDVCVFSIRPEAWEVLWKASGFTEVTMNFSDSESQWQRKHDSVLRNVSVLQSTSLSCHPAAQFKHLSVPKYDLIHRFLLLPARYLLEVVVSDLERWMNHLQIIPIKCQINSEGYLSQFSADVWLHQNDLNLALWQKYDCSENTPCMWSIKGQNYNLNRSIIQACFNSKNRRFYVEYRMAWEWVLQPGNEFAMLSFWFSWETKRLLWMFVNF